MSVSVRLMRELSWRSAECGTKNLTALQNAEDESCDEMIEGRMLHKEDMRAHCTSEEIGSKRNMRSKIGLFGEAQLTKQNKGKVRVELLVTSDKEEQLDIFAQVTYLEHDNGDK